MTDLYDLLPPSIAQDATMQAAGQAAGEQEAAVRALIPNAYIWSRLDELNEGILDHLGWSLHIDGWEYATTRELKLWLIRNFYAWHAYKGTEYGLELYWRTLLNRDLLKASPPHKSYLGSSLTDAEQAAFEAPHPEIRAYPFRTFGLKQSLFLGDCLGDPDKGYPVFPVMTDALLRCGQRLELMDPLLGQSTPLHDLLYERDQVEKLAQDVVEVRKPGIARGQFAGMPLAKPLVDHDAKSRLFTLKMQRAYGDEIERRIPLSIQPGLQPMDVYFDWVQEPGQAGQGVFLGQPLAGPIPGHRRPGLSGRRLSRPERRRLAPL